MPLDYCLHTGSRNVIIYFHNDLITAGRIFRATSPPSGACSESSIHLYNITSSGRTFKAGPSILFLLLVGLTDNFYESAALAPSPPTFAQSSLPEQSTHQLSFIDINAHQRASLAPTFSHSHYMHSPNNQGAAQTKNEYQLRPYCQIQAIGPFGGCLKECCLASQNSQQVTLLAPVSTHKITILPSPRCFQ